MSALDNLHSYIACGPRVHRGLFANQKARKQPEQLIEIYDFEACPFCRKVREVLSEMDLDAIIRPTPRGALRNRPAVKQRGGKTMFPFLVDPNTGKEMYESEDIITYLHTEYGDGRSIAMKVLAPLNTATSFMASAIRPNRGRVRKASAAARDDLELLELWSFEASPYCRKAREALCELELDYILHNVAKRSDKRPEFIARSGRMMVPYLHDPNTGTEMFESDDIVAYLYATYG